ncbi:family 16 glycoside hydrolase [Nonomuraea rhodomycinica]|uniref:Calcium-binding protein n=1 Tax=Nonomuraea rhodomycinica TaxID=1712872 RepID=A0A7Y6MEI3_9ACTN|nr:family 16 glycoside hydrolase [Nonomuraea rhodomycinica]NUW44957.1 calcium-binding protein [Nonomuraea rhodomycinica]
MRALAVPALAAVALLAHPAVPAGPAPCAPWPEGTVRAGLLLSYDGYGRACTYQAGGRGVWQLSPRPARSPAETHAALALTTGRYADVRIRVRARTLHQLRRPTPNAWEVAWVVWHYTDDDHFYYLVPKPNGWELGKVTPGYPGNQRYLATGTRSYALGVWHTIEVQQVGDTITAAVDGRRLVRFRDRERPYQGGHIGLYDEDATTCFTDLRVASAGKRFHGAQRR